MSCSAAVTSKGQITIPLEIRKRLGIATGDRVEFVTEGDLTVIRPVRTDPNVFQQFRGILGPFPGGMDGIHAWIAEMRDEED